MKKYYYIYQLTSGVNGDGTFYEKKEEFKEKTSSEHSAVQWISDHLKKNKYQANKYTIKSTYSNG